MYVATEKEGGTTLSFTHEKRKEEEEERDKISGLLDASVRVRPRKISATGKLSREWGVNFAISEHSWGQV